MLDSGDHLLGTGGRFLPITDCGLESSKRAGELLGLVPPSFQLVGLDAAAPADR
jgi:hypothetical protein